MIYTPAAGSYLTICLPGEIMRAQVDRVVTRNTVIVTLGQPMAKSHSYRLGDVVACRRTPAPEFGSETWNAIEVAKPLPEIPPEVPAPAKRKGKR